MFGTTERTFEKLIRDGGAVYVLNNTEPRGLLLCTVTDPSSGRQRKLEFPRTWIPLCLTDMLPRAALESSIELRDFFRKGLLRLVTEEEALDILSSDAAQTEYSRLMQSEFAAGGKMTDRKRKLIETQRSGQQDAQTTQPENPDADVEQLQLHPKIKAWETRVEIGNLDGPSMMTELRIHDGEFSKQDVEYFLTAKFPSEVKDWASKKIEEGGLRSESITTKVKSEKVEDASYDADWE